MRTLLARFGLKVLSIALAATLWFMIAGQKQAERSMRVALEFQNIPEGLELMGEPPDIVAVRVRGPAGTVAGLRSGDLGVMVDLSTAREGRRMFTVTPDQVVAPTGVRVVHVVPATVTLTFEPSIAKRVPVVAETVGTPAPGFSIGAIHVTPSEVDIVGPESAVKDLAHAATDPVNVRGAREQVRDKVTIGLGDPLVRLREPRDATVTVDIVAAAVDRTVPDVAVTVRNLRRGLTAQADPRGVSVDVRGLASRVGRLSARGLHAYVDVSGLGRGRYNLPVHLDPASDYTILGTTPSTVSVRIQ